jgi:hypothetical protein
LEKSAEVDFVRTRVLSLLAAAAVLAPKPLLACAVCMGASDSPVAPAINAAVFLLLGFIGTTLTGVGGFAFYLARRARQPHPPHEEFLDLNNATDASNASGEED